MKALLFLPCLLLVDLRADFWLRSRAGVGAASLDGNIREQWPLVPFTTSKGKNFSIVVAHSFVREGEGVRSVLSVPQLASYLLPVSGSRVEWRPPYPTLFSLAHKESMSGSLPRIVKMENERATIRDEDGIHYTYHRGELCEVRIDDEILYVISAHGRGPLLQARYSLDGVLMKLEIAGLAPLNFAYIGGQLATVSKDSTRIASFEYSGGLLKAANFRGKTNYFEWRENPWVSRGYTPMQFPLLLKADSTARYDYRLKGGLLQVVADFRNGERESIKYSARSGRISKDD
jgi:hypothetical protein